MKIARSAIMAVGLVRAMGIVFLSLFFFRLSICEGGVWCCARVVVMYDIVMEG